MKRSWRITILVCLLLLAGGGTVLLLPQVVPFDQCSNVYKRYADMDGIDATFIKDYKVNDTIAVSATLLEAKADSAWTVILSDFNVPVIPEEYRELVASSNSVDFWLASKDNPKDCTDTIISHNNLIVMSRQMQAICICHIKNKHQAIAIMNKETHDLKNPKNN
ncbi:MAG: hypothetical protein J6I49_09175 [Bacteroidales bacterium]|nr:hypothetical protein [Bacteroidales bacterium]